MHQNRPGLQAGLLLGEQIHRAFVGLAMNAHIGVGLQPDPRRRIQVAEIGDLQAVEEIFLNIADARFHASLLVTLAHIAGRDGKAGMMGGLIAQEARLFYVRSVQQSQKKVNCIPSPLPRILLNMSAIPVALVGRKS